MDFTVVRCARKWCSAWRYVTLAVILFIVILFTAIVCYVTLRISREHPEGITFVTKDIISPNDNSYISRTYEGLEFGNSLRALLGSNVHSDHASVTLCVHVGSLSNPPELQGLAHYTEHVLFMGSRKYPGENDMDRFIGKHGSFPNAVTDLTTTCFFYDIDPRHLARSLDMLTAAVASPLCKKSLIEKELIAVDNEFRSTFSDDFTRTERVEQVTANRKHPYSQFRLGNMESLQEAAVLFNIDISVAVMKFVEKYYSSNMMSALIFSNHSLSELEKMAADVLSPLVDRHTSLPKWTSPYQDKHLGVFIRMVPMVDETTLKVLIPLPDFYKHYRTRPEIYLLTLLAHEGEGSLFSYLRRQDKVIEVDGISRYETPGNHHIDISFKLPKDGVHYVDDIVTALFQYVAMLKKTGPKEWFFNELVKIYNNSFYYPRRDFTEDERTQLCSDIGHFPWRDTLSGHYIFDRFDPDLINKFTHLIDPSRVRIFILSKHFENDTDLLEEHYYKIRYSINPIAPDDIRRWKAASGGNFTLPERNHFIPSNFEVAAKEDNYTNLPKLIINEPSFHMWFMQNSSKNMPYSSIQFVIRHPTLTANAENIVAFELLIRLFTYAIVEPFYNAHLSGFIYETGCSDDGLYVSVVGYSQHMLTFIKTLMENMSSLKVASWENVFHKLKEDYTNILLTKVNPKQVDKNYITDFISPYLQENYFSVLQRLDSVANCDVENVQLILDTLKNDSTIEAFVHGNSVSSEARAIADVLSSTFKRGQLSFADTPSVRQAKLRRGVAYRQFKVNAQLSSNYLYMFFEVDRAGSSEDRLVALCTLLARLIKEPLFNVIRTKEQLAYMVQAVDKGQQGSFGVAFYLVTSNKLSHVEERLAKFLREYFKELLSKMSDEVFAEQKEAAMKQKLKKPQKMEDITALFWQEMIDQSYILQRISKEGAAMRSITKQDIIEFFEKFFVRVETTTVYALYLSNSTDESRIKWSTSDYNITSVDSFRADHEYHSFEKDLSVAHMSPPSE